MTRNRIEDLGRILILLDNVLNHPLFCENRMRPKDFANWFWEQSKTMQYATLDTLAFGIDELEALILEIRSIAQGNDFLNEKKES